MNKEAGKQHLHFIAEIRTKDMNIPLYAEEDKVQIVKNEKLPLLDMKMSWFPEGDLKFSIFRKKYSN